MKHTLAMYLYLLELIFLSYSIIHGFTLDVIRFLIFFNIFRVLHSFAQAAKKGEF